MKGVEFLMKKILALILTAAMALCLGACAIADENTGTAIFDTENIARITVFSYYGHGKGCDVPEENMDEIIAWLGTFKVGSRLYTETIPEDANAICVEIQYEDGTVIKKGIELTIIDGYGYYLEYDAPPDCFNDFLNRTSLIE